MHLVGKKQISLWTTCVFHLQTEINTACFLSAVCISAWIFLPRSFFSSYFKQREKAHPEQNHGVHHENFQNIFQSINHHCEHLWTINSELYLLITGYINYCAKGMFMVETSLSSLWWSPKTPKIVSNKKFVLSKSNPNGSTHRKWMQFATVWMVTATSKIFTPRKSPPENTGKSSTQKSTKEVFL